MAEQPLYFFAVYAPDYTDADAPARRLAVRPQHLANAKVQREKLNIIRLGGALISPDSYQSDERKMIGSMGVYQAASLEAMWEIIKSDLYWTGNVWDKEKTVVFPYQPAFPLPTNPPAQ
ncbi:YCII domain-containing protein [Phanerochaete sordida]|uniref:YCII domain-containing protein n=1 Tax=Phanerochaete sordida TaxID=48140 RepID=A0A9P3GLS8_9APHY|nr:YCII domain-containing protein [Phanerochaete sordida]